MNMIKMLKLMSLVVVSHLLSDAYADNWRDIAEPFVARDASKMAQVTASSEKVKFGMHAYIKLLGWLTQHTAIEQPDQAAWAIMGEKDQDAIDRILKMVDLDIVEREILKELDARRSLFVLTLVHKSDPRSLDNDKTIEDLIVLRAKLLKQISDKPKDQQ